MKWLSLFLLFLAVYSFADDRFITVATIERPPFSMLSDAGEWTGFSVELIDEIAQQENLKIIWQQETVFADMLDHVANGDVTMAAANISVTADREKRMDFSQPIYDSGLQIITNKENASISFLKIIWESGILLFLGGAFIILLIVAHFMWFFERGEDAKHDYFRDEYLGGIWDAFWWAFVICTMGGFEKERPENIMGRIIAVFWILASLFFISTLTAKITSALTVSQLSTGISSYKDLYGKKVGAPKGTTMSRFLDNHDITYVEYDDFSQTLVDLKKNKIEAVVGDAAVSQYYIQTNHDNALVIAGDVFAKDNISFAFTENSPHFESINSALIKMKEDGRFESIRKKYFGE